MINNDGNLLDAFNYAALLALERYKLNFVTVEGGKIKIWPAEEKRPQTLSIHHFPISLTFCILGEENKNETKEYLALDPSVIFILLLENGRRLL